MIRMIICIFLLILLFTGCVEKEPIRIGFVASMSGKWMHQSISARNGALLAIEQQNEAGGILGRQIDLMIEDDMTDLEMADDIYQKFSDNGIEICIGHTLSMFAPAVKESELLFISPCMTTMTMKGFDDNFFVLAPKDTEMANLMVEDIVKNKLGKVYFVYEGKNRLSTEKSIQYVSQKLEEKGIHNFGEFAYDSLDSETMKACADSIENEGYKAVVFWGPGGAAAMTMQHINSKEGKKFYAAGAFARDLIEIGGESLDGLNIIDFYHDPELEDYYTTFESEYIKRFGSEPDLYAVLGYEAAYVMVDAVKSANSTDSNDVKAALLEKDQFKGLRQYFRFDAYGDPIRMISLFEYHDGVFRLSE